MLFYLLVILAIVAFLVALFLLFHTVMLLGRGINLSPGYMIGRGLMIAIGLVLAYFCWTQAGLTIG